MTDDSVNDILTRYFDVLIYQKISQYLVGVFC